MRQMPGHMAKSSLTPKGCSLPSDKLRAEPAEEALAAPGSKGAGAEPGTSQTLPGLLGSQTTRRRLPDPRPEQRWGSAGALTGPSPGPLRPACPTAPFGARPACPRLGPPRPPSPRRSPRSRPSPGAAPLPGTPGLEWGYSLQDVLARTPPWVVPDPGLPPDKSDPGTEAGAPLLLKTFQQAWKQRLDEGCWAGRGTHVVPTACPPDEEAGSGMPSRTQHFCKATGHTRSHCHSSVP